MQNAPLRWRDVNRAEAAPAAREVRSLSDDFRRQAHRGG
jgi:hypothetical protein